MVERGKIRVLVIAPHMDDEVLGVGGTIAKHVNRGDEVYVSVVANRAYEHKYDADKIRAEMECAESAWEVLGYRNLEFINCPDERLVFHETLVVLEETIECTEPNIVYIPHRGDLNQDHQTVFHAASVALRPHANKEVDSILCYEVPSSTDQAPPFPEYAFQPNFYVNIEDTLDKKVTALKCYKTENRPFPFPRSPEGIITMAKKRGMESGYNAAEAFIIMRSKWR